VIAAVLSLIGRPIIRFLKRKLKFPNTLAVVSTMTLFLGMLFGLISMFIPLIIKQGKNLSLLDINQLEYNIENLINQANEYFASRGINILDQLKSVDIFSNFKAIPNLLNDVIGAVGSLSIGLFSVLFIVFFFMKDSHLLHNGLMVIVPDKTEGRFSASLEKIEDLLSRYFIGLVTQITILFVLYTIILLIFGVDNAVVIAFLCALLNLIPYVGPLIGGTLMLLLTMTSHLDQDFQTVILPKTIYVMIGYVIAQLVDNFFSQPFIFSQSVKSHPLEIFLIIIIGGLLFGVTGMIIAVPTYTALKVILKEFLADNKIVKSLTKDL
jgi:predicted PurR-regulated permease PerM